MTTVQQGAAVADVVEDAYPLAALQAGMLFHSMYAERVATYHDVLTLTVRGRFDREALDAVLAELVSRHPVLRTSFDLTDFSEPVQLVHRTATLLAAVTDLRGVPETEADEQVAAWATEEQFRAYDLERPPLLRIAAHLLPGDRFALSISFHHAILDGWSAATLATELVRRYRARLDGRPLPVDQLPDSYVDFVAAEREAVASAEAESFWREIVVGSPPGRLPRMPGYPRGGGGASEHLYTAVDDGVAQRLRAVAARLGVPLRAVLLAAHLRVMSLVTGEPEVLTGTVTNGRPETDTSAEILGLFLNLVPVRLTVDQTSWAALILAVHDGYVRSLAHRRYPLFEMQRLADRSPLCDTSFDYRDFHVYRALGPSADSVEITGSSHLETTDLPFNAAFGRSGDDGLALTISYDSTQFPVVQIETIRGYYLTALAAIAADADGDPRPASPFLGADLVRMAAWNDTGTGPEPCPTLPALVAGWARRDPTAVAVVDGDGELTYEQLWQRVCGLADRLRERGVRTGSVVAVAVPRSADALVAMLAVLQAGGAVLPLDTDHPERRLRETIRSATAMAVVTRADVADKFTQIDESIAVVDVASIAGPDGDTAPTAADPDSLAFVLFTSGSTGKPKGVMLSHRSAVAYSYGQAHRLGLHTGSRIALRSPLSVDSAVAEVVMAFGVGGALAVVPTEAVVDPDTFVATFTGYGITMAILVPSLIAPHVQAGTFARCPTLDVICSVGEALPRSLAEAFLGQCGARLFNLYGPTEAGIGLTEFPVRLDHPAGVVPIGGPTAGVTLHVLDASGQPVPIGTPGHLYAGGTQLALGYLGDPELTAAAFVPDHVSRLPGARLYRTGDLARWLPDGVVEFIGRADGQVKVRGVRVEPGEIEARLLEHPQVRQSVVQVYRVGERDILTAHVVWSGDGTVADELRAFLADRLPRALIPTAYVAIEDLPVLPNGKVDRSALPEPTGTVGGYVPPRDHVEARLAARWEEILDVPMVGVFDDFFALGGHSLHALRLTMLIRRDFDREVPVAALLSAPTVAGLAAHLRAPDNLAPKVELVAFRDHGTRPPLFFMHPLGGQVFRYQKVARALGDDQPVYALPARGFLDGEQPHETLAAMADDYAGYIVRRYPHGPYLVGGMCVGGNIALEVARRLRRTGADVPLVFAFWSHADNPVSPDQQDDATLMMYALAGSPFELDRASLAGRDADEQLLAIVSGAAQAGRLNPAATDIEQARRILRVYRANANALSGNKHEPYDGDVVLLKPVEAQEFAFEDDFSWREVVGDRLRILPIPGRQDTFADEPQATEVAAILKGLIDSVITGS